MRSPLAPVRRLGFPFVAPTHPGGVERLPERRRTGLHYETDWARRYPARVARLAVTEGPMRLVVRAIASPTRRGADRLDRLEGPAVFAANHHSHLDTPLVLTSVPEPWRHRIAVAAAADYFFRNRVRGALSALAMGAIPIDRTRVSRESADRAAELIDDGWSLLIFPEGGRSPDGWGQAFRGGAAYLALRCDVPVVPVHVSGTGRILRKGSRRVTPAATRVTFGTPLRAEPGDDARRFASRIEQAVAALADESHTDWWSARKRAAKGETPALTGPETESWRRTWALPDHRRRRSRLRSHRRSWPAL